MATTPGWTPQIIEPPADPTGGPCRRCWHALSVHGACDCADRDEEHARHHDKAAADLEAEGVVGRPAVIAATANGRQLAAPAVDYEGRLLSPILLAMNRELVAAAAPEEVLVVHCCRWSAQVMEKAHGPDGPRWWALWRTWMGITVVPTAPLFSGWRVCRLQPVEE